MVSTIENPWVYPEFFMVNTMEFPKRFGIRPWLHYIFYEKSMETHGFFTGFPWPVHGIFMDVPSSLVSAGQVKNAARCPPRFLPRTTLFLQVRGEKCCPWKLLLVHLKPGTHMSVPCVHPSSMYPLFHQTCIHPPIHLSTHPC